MAAAFLTSLGELVENNLGAFITAVIAIIGIIVWLVRLESKSDKVTEKVNDLRDDMTDIIGRVDTHIEDRDMHVNLPYIGTLKDRIENLEKSVDDLKDKVLEKMDSRFDQVLARIGK